MRLVLALLLLCFACIAGAEAENASANSTNLTLGTAGDVQWGSGCSFSIDRKITSTKWLATVTTVLSNDGGNGCSLRDVIFEDSLPLQLGAMGRMSFSPNPVKIENRTVWFAFASFAAGESKTLVYGSRPAAVSPADFSAGEIYRKSEQNSSNRPAIIPVAIGKQFDALSLYEAAFATAAVGTFIILAAGIGAIYYLEKKKNEKAQH